MFSRPIALVILCAAVAAALWLAAAPSRVRADDALVSDNDPLRAVEQRVLKALSRRVSIDFQHRPFAEALRELGRFLGLEMRLDQETLAEAGFDPKQPVTFRVSGISAESALNLLLRTCELTWTIDASGLLITTPEAERSRLVSRVYRVSEIADLKTPTGVLGLETNSPEADSWVEMLQTTIQPSDWAEVGGMGSAEVLDEGGETVLKVSQRWRAHREIETLLRDLQRAREATKADPEAPPVAVACPGWEKDLRRVLAQKCVLELDDTPFDEVIRSLEREFNINIEFDRNALKDVGFQTDSRVTLKVRGISLAAGLTILLRSLGLTWHLRDEAVVITSREEESVRLVPRVYDVRDLVRCVDETGQAANDSDSLIELIASTIQPTSWDVVGGPGSMAAAEAEGLAVLAISQTGRAQQEIESLLAELRRVRDAAVGANRPAPVPTNRPAWEERILRALAQEVSLSLKDRPLQEVIDDLKTRLQIEIQLDVKALEEVAFQAAKRVTLEVSRIPARSAIDLLLRAEGLTWTLQHEVLWITTPDEEANQLRVKVYDVRDVVAGYPAPPPFSPDFDSLIDIITTCVRPTMWDEVGGPGSIYPFQSQGLAVIALAQTYQTHEFIENLLAQMRQVRGTPRPKHGAPARIVDIGGGADRLVGAGNQRVSLEVKEVPFREAIEGLKKVLSVEIQFDRKALDEVGFDPEKKVTLELAGVSAASALDALMEREGLAWMPYGPMLLVTTPDEEANDPVVRVYDVRDLVPRVEEDNVAQADFDSLIEILTSCIEPSSWDDAGGPGAIGPYEADELGVLVVAQSWLVHRRIEEVLAALRSIRHAGPHEAAAVPGPPVIPAWEKSIRKALDQQISLDIRGKSLRDAAATLRKTLHVEVQLDEKGLEEVGIETDSPDPALPDPVGPFAAPALGSNAPQALRTEASHPVTLQCRGVCAATALDRLVEPLGLCWTVCGEALWITTPDRDSVRFTQPRVYAVAGLLGPRTRMDMERLIERLQSDVEERSWNVVGGSGSVQPFEAEGITALVVWQTWRNHRKIEDLLATWAKNPGALDSKKP